MYTEEQRNTRLDRATRGYTEDRGDDYRDESIAYALATGIAPIGSIGDLDADIERSQRRARWERRKAKR